jgi:hypothetical protein
VAGLIKPTVEAIVQALLKGCRVHNRFRESNQNHLGKTAINTVAAITGKGRRNNGIMK